LNIYGYRYGGEIAKWLSEFLEAENIDLVNFGNDLEPRMSSLVDKKLEWRKDDEIIYSDDSPFLLISEASLSDLNSRLKEKVSMRNFRPNFVVKDVTVPYAEVYNLILYFFFFQITHFPITTRTIGPILRSEARLLLSKQNIVPGKSRFKFYPSKFLAKVYYANIHSPFEG
jgi:hypothetical protein